MKILVLCLLLASCTYAPTYAVVRDSYNTYAPTYAPQTTTQTTPVAQKKTTQKNYAQNHIQRRCAMKTIIVCLLIILAFSGYMALTTNNKPISSVIPAEPTNTQKP
jgi:hypothetical protein